VSPSWRDRLLITLAPERVAVLRLKRGLRARIAGDAVRGCAAADGRGAPPWAAALEALEQLLAEQGAGTWVASVIVSNQFVRYVRVPWTEGVSAEADRLALAAGCFRAVHGDAVDAWRVVLDAPRFGADNLAAALDAALIDELRALLARHKRRLGSLRPHLTAAFDRWRDRLAPEVGAFALVEPGCVTTLFRRDGRWAEVANRRHAGADEPLRIIGQCVEAESLLGGAGEVAVLAPGAALGGTGGSLRWLTGLEGPWPQDPWRSMAWNAA